MEKKTLLVLLVLSLPLGCGSANQNPTAVTWGTSTQSNSNMNYQPQVIVGSQPLGRENLAAAITLDIQEQEAQLSVLEDAAKRELTLADDHHLSYFPPPLNTSVFAAMKVAYPKELLELDAATRTSFITFYRQLDEVNNDLNRRSTVTLSALTNSSELIKKTDRHILLSIDNARKAVQDLKRR